VPGTEKLLPIQPFNDVDKPFNYFSGYVFGIDFVDLLGYLNSLLKSINTHASNKNFFGAPG
jgi:hypothetical protein